MLLSMSDLKILDYENSASAERIDSLSSRDDFSDTEINLVTVPKTGELQLLDDNHYVSKCLPII